MIDEPFFVMLFTQDDSYTPLMDEDGHSVARFSTEEEARDAAGDNILGGAFGFEVFEIGDGK